MFSKNDYQRVVLLNSSSEIVGGISEKKLTTQNYFRLQDKNEQIASENAYLREKIIRNSATFNYANSKQLKLSSDQYRLYPAKVVNNSTHLSNNYITLNVGSSDGIEVGFGVISDQGVVGSVISCSNNYSLVVYALHSQTMISAKVNRSGD